MDECRKQFETLMSLPPYEMNLERQGDNGAWPGNYRSYPVQLAWCAWEELWNRRELSGNSEQVEPVVDHIEDVRGRSMADAAVGKCDCDPHIEYCPSCAPYLHEPLKPAGEEDKATYKQIADNYTSPANCPRCAELELQNSILEKELSQQANRIKELETKLTLFVSRG